MNNKITNNGTPFSDEAWKRWYSHKSNKERALEAEQARQDDIQENSEDLESKLKELDNI